jgi:hypothetical protein
VTVTDSKPPARRSYPDVYEKLIPVALGIIVAATVVVLLVVFAVALRLVPGVAF